MVPSPKVVINLPWTYDKLHNKIKDEGCVVIEILWYTHTDAERQTKIVLLLYKDNYKRNNAQLCSSFIIFKHFQVREEDTSFDAVARAGSGQDGPRR